MTSPKDIKGYDNVSKTENSKGEFGKDDTEVTYYYEKTKQTTPSKPVLPTTGDNFISEMIILVASATTYLAVLALKHKRCK